MGHRFDPCSAYQIESHRNSRWFFFSSFSPSFRTTNFKIQCLEKCDPDRGGRSDKMAPRGMWHVPHCSGQWSVAGGQTLYLSGSFYFSLFTIHQNVARATFKTSGILSRGNGVERTRFRHPRNALLAFCRALGGGKKWPDFGSKRLRSTASGVSCSARPNDAAFLPYPAPPMYRISLHLILPLHLVQW